MNRDEIARILDECGTLLELRGESKFRVNAYHNAARSIQQVEEDLAELVASKRLEQINGIGKTMAEKITELVQTGKSTFYEELRTAVPTGLVEMLRINGLGAKRIAAIHQQLQVDTLEKLKAACLDGRVAGLKGLGKKTAENILKGIEHLEKVGRRVLYETAQRYARALYEALADHPAVQRLEVCGSLRRGSTTVKDIDLLVASAEPAPIMQRFVEHPDVDRIIAHGDTKSSVILRNGMPADLRVVSDDQYPFALHYFTGSKNHNIAMRQRAIKQGLRLNEYELAGEKKNIACREEADLFEALGLEFIPPELREDTGEIEAAEHRQLPTLIQYGDLTGTFHCHTNASDGADTLAELAAAARALGYAYLGIGDHSQSLAVANGLSPERVQAQWNAIETLNQQWQPFRVFKGIESDILSNGALDYETALLAGFDYIVGSVHSHMQMDEATMTKRLLTAIQQPFCTMLGHPTGRLLLRREPYLFDMDAVLKEAVARQVLIEINANPVRLDLDWLICKRAKTFGVQFVINPDAHSQPELHYNRLGVLMARKAWLTAADVFNTRPLDQIQAWLQQRRLQALASTTSNA